MITRKGIYLKWPPPTLLWRMAVTGTFNTNAPEEQHLSQIFKTMKEPNLSRHSNHKRESKHIG